MKIEIEELKNEILEALHVIYGVERGVNFSKSCSFKGIEFFVTVLKKLSEMRNEKGFSYLEIGSFEGVSMTVVAQVANVLDLDLRLTSVDPYFEDGYMETHPAVGTYEKLSNPSTQQRAFQLYQRFNLKVNHLHGKSTSVMSSFIRNEEKFDVIYVDGYHNGLMPLCDIAFSLRLLNDNSILVVDDYFWPEIEPIKSLLDKSLVKIAEIEDIVAYGYPGEMALY